ncbi:hypothetical protein HPB52_009955 [Rhipicephalus sanguineus]|uniref:Ig-like domain-containing protein n=1 Tax=Rhipicephalus sanguineus TaxID=34632 RepID=A0A9D4PRF4_RHISA|nr:hypothetical protein HPB52_009955 [Rhipicephalus sanguineus]
MEAIQPLTNHWWDPNPDPIIYVESDLPSTRTVRGLAHSSLLQHRSWRPNRPHHVAARRQSIKSGPDIEVHVLDPFSVALAIDSLSPSHDGSYKCLASSSAATVNYTAQLRVHGE